MLINYNGKYDDVSTLAHELGPHDAELLLEQDAALPAGGLPDLRRRSGVHVQRGAAHRLHARSNIKDDDTRLSLLGNYLENIKGTVFRQTQFAEFELRMHEMAQKGQPITGDALAKLYMDITKKYYGHDQGVMRRRRLHRATSGATSRTSTATSTCSSTRRPSPRRRRWPRRCKAATPRRKRRYLAFLSAGGSKYPIDLLKDAGVDMTTDEPLDLTMKAMNARDGRNGEPAGETRALTVCTKNFSACKPSLRLVP